MRLRPIGDGVFVVFPQGEWAKKTADGFVVRNDLFDAPHRMDGLVVAVGPKVNDVAAGQTVYGDPRRGRVLVVDDTMYHIMRKRDLVAKWEAR